MKSGIVATSALGVVSLPAWGEWIEIRFKTFCRLNTCQSLPAWGEWIEIVSKDYDTADHMESLPAWGEWIEIRTITILSLYVCVSLPAWGEWIEINLHYYKRRELSLSPHGESGLKSDYPEHDTKGKYRVSPRMGRVD